MIYLKLHQLAEEFSTDQSQRAFLESIVFEDERSFSRLLHENTAHEVLLGGDFGVCCLALLALQGTKDMWRTLQGFGYGARSALYYPKNYDEPPNSQIAGLAQMTVWGGLLSLGGVERVKNIHKWLKADLWDVEAFANGAEASLGFGLMHWEEETFSCLLGVLKSHIE